MNKLSVFLTLHISCMSCCYAQNNIGPRLLGMGRNTAAINDVWSINGNVAAVNQISKTTIAVNYIKYNFDNELSNQGFTALIPLKNTYLGFSVQRYGISVYNEINTGILLTKRFGQKLSIGIKGNYHQLKINNYGNKNGYTINLGIHFQLNPQIGLGIYSINLTNSYFQKENINSEIPGSTHIGVSYQASKKILIASTISRFSSHYHDVSLGLEYQILEEVALRTGISAKPFKQYLGIGFCAKKLTLDLALENDKNLGYIPQIALGYAF